MKALRHHRLILAGLIVVACAACACAFGMIAQASSTSGSTDTTAPTWLQSQATQTLNGFVGSEKAAAAVTSLAWVKTTWGQYEAAVNGGGDANSSSAVFVVVAHGDFTSNLAAGEEAPISAKVLVMTFDSATQKLSTIDALYTDQGVNESLLGKANPMPLAE